MAPHDRPNYLKAAFANVYNLSLLGGAAAASALTGDWVVGITALGAEALWLLFGPDIRPFKRAVDRWHREEQDTADRVRMAKVMDALPKRDWSRAHALDELRREVERDMQHNPSFQAILLQPELDKLEQLNLSFVTLASSCARAETYLSATDVREVQRQVEIQRGVERNMQDPAVQEIARKNIVVLEKRTETIRDIETFLARARGQMNLIENSVRLLRDQALTMGSPAELAEQLDDLLMGVDAIQESARDHDDLLSTRTLEPLATVAPMDADSESGLNPNARKRVR